MCKFICYILIKIRVPLFPRGMKGTKNFWNVQIYLQFFRMGSPKSYARMGRAKALVARWLSGAVSAIATQVPNAKYRCSLAECTVSSGADRSERSEDKKGTKKFWDNKLLKNNEQARFLKINNGQWPITRSLAEFKVRRIFGRNANFRKFWDYYRLPWTD